MSQSKLVKPFSASARLKPIESNEARRLGLDVQPIPDGLVKHYGLVRVEECWSEAPLGKEWIVAARIVPQHGQPVVAELRVFPFTQRKGSGDNKRHAGQWPGQWFGVKAAVPRGGLSSRLVRQIRIAQGAEQVSATLAAMERAYGKTIFSPEHLLGRLGLKSGSSPPSGKGRKGLPDQVYARVAQDYVDAILGGSRRPVADVARKWKEPVPRMRDMVHRARERGFLTDPTMRQGRAGGTLTPRAKAVLMQLGRIQR